MRKIAEDIDGLFEYYQNEKGHVFYYGGLTGRGSGAFGPMEYWKDHLTRRPVFHGPWQFLDSVTESWLMGEWL